MDRRVYALGGNGQVLWQARAGAPVYALAVLTGGRMAFGDDAGQVALYSSSGQRLGQHDLGTRVTALHAGWQGGLLAGGWDQRLTLLDLETPSRPAVTWQSPVGGPITGIATLPERAVVSTLAGDLRAFDDEGREVWRFSAGAPVTGLGIVEGGSETCLLAAVQDGRLLCLATDGTTRWERTFGLGTEGSPVWHAADLDGDGQPEVVAGTGGIAAQLAALSIDGAWWWQASVPKPVNALTTLDLDGDGKLEILAGLANGEIRAFEGRCGRSAPAESPVEPCPGPELWNRGSVHAGLPVWGLIAAPTAGRVFVLADVVAWEVAAVPGPAGGPWLPPPAMVSDPGAVDQAWAAAGEGQASLVFLGDVALSRSMERQLARYGPGFPWTGLAPLLERADLVAINLEGVLTREGAPLVKPYILRAHPLWAESLVAAHFGLATLANNHVLDFGLEGLDETMDTLAGQGIATVGAGRSAAEARQPAEFTLNGVRVAVLGYAAARWDGSADVPSTDRLAWARPDEVEADVRAARGRADVVVVLLHAGTEYAAAPSADQVAVARAAAEAGADLVVGHHPHVTQTVERYRQGLIVYSLGDALFDIPRRQAMQGDLLRAIVSKEGLVRAELWPFWIEDAIRPRLLDDGAGNPQVKVIYPIPR